MKKTIILIMAFFLIATLAACQSNTPSGTGSTNPPAENTNSPEGNTSSPNPTDTTEPTPNYITVITVPLSRITKELYDAERSQQVFILSQTESDLISDALCLDKWTIADDIPAFGIEPASFIHTKGEPLYFSINPWDEKQCLVVVRSKNALSYSQDYYAPVMALDDFKIAVDTLTPLPGKIRDKDRRYFDLFRADRAFIVVPELFKSAYSKYVDDSLATYAIMRMNWDGYDDEKGSPKSDYDAITEKHFGLKLKNFNNGRTETIPGTENVRVGGGFSYNSGQYLIPVGDMVRNTDGSLTGEFKYYIISDSFFDWSGDVPDHAYNIDEYLLTGNDADFPEPQILQVTFEIRRDEDGEYLFYHNVKSLK